MAKPSAPILLGEVGLRRLSKTPAKIVLAEWRRMLNQAKRQTVALANTAPATWDDFVLPLMAIDDELQRAWGRITHLSAVMDSPVWRQVMKRGEPWLTAYATWESQHRGLATKYQQVADRPGSSELQRRVLDRATRRFKLNGAYASPAKQRRIRRLKLELAKLSTTFAERLLDASAASFVEAIRPAEVVGIPAPLLAIAQQRAKQARGPGWRFRVQGPEYVMIMQTAKHRGLRRRVYIAGVTRASEFGPARYDNTVIVGKILDRRQRLARILDFPTYADLSLSRKMAARRIRAERFLRRLAKPAKRQAAQEFARLRQFAADQLGIQDFRPWDMDYVSEQLRQRRFGFNQETLRPYFPLSGVVATVWATAEKVLGIRIRPVKHLRGYRQDLKAYDIFDRRGRPHGRLWFDFFVRPEKRQGYWQHTDTSRAVVNGKVQLPVAYIVGNFPVPNRQGESYLDHREVETVFHELGHALHTVLTEVDVSDVAGTNGVEWDAVELPSQWFEQFAWEPSVMQAIAKRAGKRLSPSQLRALERARTFQGGLWVNRQLMLALFDLTVHAVRHPDRRTAQRTWVKIFHQFSVVPRFSQARLANSFSHLFDGPYAAGYYSYLWAEVLAADAYDVFAGRPGQWANWGRKFRREVLAVGGSKPPAEAYRAFRGRDPRPTALYRRYGLSGRLDGRAVR